MEGTDNGDSAARAYAAIVSQLEEWTSPKVGTMASLSTSSSLPTEDQDDSSEYDEEDEEVMNWIRQDVTPQKRSSPGTSTPVMSNSAKKQQREPSPLALRADDAGDDDQIMDMDMGGIQSPWFQRTASPLARDEGRGSSNDYHEYRRYHDALFTYLVGRRNLSERLRIQEEEAQLAVVDSQEMQNLNKEEGRVEMDLLGALSTLCLDRMADDRALREGNLWSLLATLRSIGMESLLYPDNPTDHIQHQQQIDMTLQDLAMDTEKTPAEILNKLHSRSPLVLARRKLLLEWMEQCQELLLPQVTMPSKKQTAMWPASLARLQQGVGKQPGKVGSLHPDEPLLVLEPSFSVTPADPLYGNDDQENAILLKACLALILAGQMDRAMDLCRQCGQSWRAAAWGGGTPHGIESTPDPETQLMVREEQGNPHRALWKRTCWKLSGSLSNKMAPTGSSVNYEAAINALLSNDVTTALSSPVLPAWEQHMQAVFGAMMGRVEDDLLYRHNNNRRKVGKRFPFPGTEHEREEREQLQCTAFLANLTEASVFETIRSYSQAEADDPLRSAQAAFIIGKTAVAQFIADEGAHLDETDISYLRFLTHLSLYLDSLSASTTSTTIPALEPVKNAVLLQYVRYLASRSDLWRMLALYASLLPTEILLECYPTFLSRVEGDTERRGMLKDARELFPPGLDLVILKCVVKMLLSEEDGIGALADVRKMKAILWLCYYPEHMGDALICSNTLLRQFLLDSTKIKSAIVFLDKFLPDTVVETVMEKTREEEQPDEDEDMQDAAAAISDVKNALAEHGALQCYLQAEKAFDEWKTVVANTPFATTNVDKHNLNALTATEAEIAKSMERRDVIRHKRSTSQAVIQAADSAKEKLLQVLVYPGGFLIQDKDTGGSDDSEPRRCDELDSLRRRCLPRIVFLLHHVCDETASWMKRFLDDGVPRVGESRMAFLAALDDVKESESSPLAPIYWLQHASSLAETVASEEYEIYKAFETYEMKKFLALMAETSVKELQHSADTKSENKTKGPLAQADQDIIEIDDDL